MIDDSFINISRSLFRAFNLHTLVFLLAQESFLIIRLVSSPETSLILSLAFHLMSHISFFPQCSSLGMFLLSGRASVVCHSRQC